MADEQAAAAEATIETPDMPADGAARYRVMVAETQRMAREVATMAEKLRQAEAEKARLRAALGLAP